MHDFSFKIFCLAVPKNFAGEHFSVSLISGSEKVWIRGGGGVSKFSAENFLSHSAENFRRGILYCCNNFEKVWIRGGGGISRFSVEIFMSHSAENFRQQILLFLRKFLVSKSFMDEKGVSRFSVENFWSHSAEKFRGHPFNVSKNSGYPKLLCIIGVITNFRRKFFVSQCRKTS